MAGAVAGLRIIWFFVKNKGLESIKEGFSIKLIGTLVGGLMGIIPGWWLLSSSIS